MILTRDFSADIRIFYDFDDMFNSRRSYAPVAYLEKHGWKELGGFCGKDDYMGYEVEGCHHYVKAFTDIDQMKSELEDIELAFHDPGTIINYDEKWGPARGYKIGRAHV